MKVFWRFYVSLLVAWCAFWLIVGGFNAYRQGVASELFIKASRQGDQIGIVAMNGLANMHAELVKTALMVGFFWAVPGFLALATGGLVFGLLNKRASQ